jgi:hypothetical protein
MIWVFEVMGVWKSCVCKMFTNMFMSCAHSNHEIDHDTILSCGQIKITHTSSVSFYKKQCEQFEME